MCLKKVSFWGASVETGAIAVGRCAGVRYGNDTGGRSFSFRWKFRKNENIERSDSLLDYLLVDVDGLFDL